MAKVSMSKVMSFRITFFIIFVKHCVNTVEVKDARIRGSTSVLDGIVEVKCGNLWYTACEFQYLASGERKYVCEKHFENLVRYATNTYHTDWDTEVVNGSFAVVYYISKYADCNFESSCSQILTTACEGLQASTPAVSVLDTRFAHSENTIISIGCKVMGGIPEPTLRIIPRDGARIVTDPTYLTRKENMTNYYQTLVYYSKLEVNISHEDNGAVYWCEVEQLNFQTQNESITLKVQYAPVIKVPVNKTVNEGSNVTVECVVRSNPTAVVGWYGPVGVEKSNSKILNLQSVGPLQMKNYSCVAVNNFNSSTFTTSRTTAVYVNHIMVPRQVFVAEFEDIEINCTVVSYTEITEVIWRRGDDTILSNSSIFYLKNTSRGDMGLYVCQSKNRIDAEIQTMSKVTKLHVEYPPIVKVPDNTTADDQEDVILHCIVDSHPESTITWYSPDNEVLSNTSMLELKNVNRSYIGNYTCKGQNVVKGSTRSDRSTTYLFVNYAPIIQIPRNTTVNKLQDVVIECEVLSFPPSTFQWQNQNGDIVSNTSSLELNNVQPTDAGRYTCLAVNIFRGTSHIESASTILFVTYPPVVEVPSNITVNDQDDLILQCIVNSYPPSSVTWYSPDTKKVSNTSMLELKNVSRTYIGEYTCRAENEIQGLTFTTSNSTLLFVNFAPVVVVSHNTTAVEFQDIVIDCKVVSYPMSTVTWQNYNNQDISNSSGLLLKYVRPKDEGIYTCTAENVIQGNHHTRSASTTLYITPNPTCYIPNAIQTKQHCRCNRRCTYLKNILNITMEQARNAMDQIKKELTVEPTTLTSYIIKKISMKNSNTSSIGIGVIAIMIIILVFGFLVGGDIIKLAKYLHDRRRLELKEVKTVNNTPESKEIRAKTNKQRKKRKLKKCKGDKENEGLNPKYRTLKKL